MKALSLWQPWASAIAVGAKYIETRSWSTTYRGPLAIHAAKRYNAEEMALAANERRWKGALTEYVSEEMDIVEMYSLPLGAIVATCELTDCRPSDAFALEELNDMRKNDTGEWCQSQMGDFSVGRFGWVLQNIQRLPEPVPFRGRQQLFNIPDDLLKTGDHV